MFSEFWISPVEIKMPNTVIWRNLKAHKIHNLIKNKTGHWPNKYGKHDIMYEIFSNSHKSQEKKKKTNAKWEKWH